MSIPRFSPVAVLLVLSLSVSAAAGKPPAPELYALYCWSDGYVKYAQDVHKLGIRWLRVGDLAAGGDRADKAMLLAAAGGVNLVPVLGMREMSHGKTMEANQAVEKYRQVVRQAVRRYGPGGEFFRQHKEANAAAAVRYWEIWNEPNIEFLTPPDDPNGMLRTECYAMLLKAASEEIRKLDPGAVIIAFNTAGGAWDIDRALKPDTMFQKLKYIGWRKFIKDVVAITGPDCFDAVGLHPYTQPLSPESGNLLAGLAKLRETAREMRFDGKPVWFTEVGFPIEYPNNKQVRDERQQACFTVRMLALAGAHGVTQAQIMYIEDIVYGPDSTRRSFGFFTAPGKWREQAKATGVMMRLVPDPRKDAKALSEKTGGAFAYQFQGAGGRPVVMAWTDGNEPAELVIRYPLSKASADRPAPELVYVLPEKNSPVTVVDMLGRCSDPTSNGDKLTVALTEAPVYVIPAPKEEVQKLLKD